MTKLESKVISLEVWEWLSAHPWANKRNLPKKLYDKIKKVRCSSPLCEIFYYCNGCPLCSCSEESNYRKWVDAIDSKDRQFYAQAIVDNIKAWNPEE
jgi:hypothetical protein